MIPDNTIVCGDCLEVMREFPDKSVDMILCDLPYGITACKWDTVIPFEPLWAQYKRLIKDNGAIVLTASQPFTSALVMSNIEMFRQELIWDKKQGNDGVQSHRRHMKAHENILLFSKKQSVFHPQITEKPKVNQRYKPPAMMADYINNTTGLKYQLSKGFDFTKSYPTSVLSYSMQMAECNSAHRIHPTQKPVALFEYLIRTYTNEGDIVLDNCAGSFTTAVAALRTGRRFIGIEISQTYCDLARKRVAAEMAQLKLDLSYK